MFGLEIITAGLLSIAPVPVSAVLECHRKAPPRINVRPTKGQVQYDFTKDKAALNSVDVDTVSPYGPRHKTTVSGLMSGSIQLKSNLSFLHETHSYLDKGCVYLKSVNVQIKVEPTIFVAKEYPKGGCMHTAILAHEFKHVQADQLIVNKYINLIGRKLERVVEAKGDTYGPMKKIRMKEVQENVRQALNDVVIDMNDVLNRERRIRQQDIDNLEEYKSIGVRCKSKDKPRRR